MPTSILQVSEFRALFAGNVRTRGQFIPAGKKDENGKEQGKCSTEAGPLNEDHYREHLEGKRGLGVVPIHDDNKCAFAVLDIDEYSTQLGIPAMLRKYGMSLIPFRSKSGGLHLYLFFSAPVLAKEARKIMAEYRRLLGLSNKTEIFPKQDTINEGDSGNWINLPYFNTEETARYIIKADGTGMPFYEAVEYIKAHRYSPSDIEKEFEDLPFSDAPPCLQSIYLRGSTAMRNNYLFSFAVFLKNKYGDEFEFKIVEVNNALEAPLPIKELQATIIESIKKKDYAYKCEEDPILSLCNKSACRKRKYGIGSSEVPELTYEELVQYVADPPYYEWKINGQMLRFYSEQDIISQNAFRSLCFRHVHVLPLRLKDETWTRVVNTALKNMVAVGVDEADDISVGAMFRNYLAEFCTRRAMAANKEQIIADRVYKDEERWAYVFKAKCLVAFLVVQKQFRAFGQTEVQARLKDMGGAPTRYYVNKENSSVRVWELPVKALESVVEPDIDQLDVNFMEEHSESDY